ncbi:MAG: recombinase XerD, partial [Marmoricola sp.]|nr:recombinase XerD [Marmoricola sp.]
AQCARCAGPDDLTAMLVHDAGPPTMSTIVDIFCGVDRPEIIYTWKRSPQVHDLLTGLASGQIPLTHKGLDELGDGRHVAHLRSVLEHNGRLPRRDEHLVRFESWLATKLEPIPQTSVRRPAEQFATWHHLIGCAETPCPGSPPTGRSARRNKRSPRPSSSCAGSSRPITAPRPPATNKTSTKIW